MALSRLVSGKPSLISYAGRRDHLPSALPVPAACRVGVRFYDVPPGGDGDCTIILDHFESDPPLPIELSSFSTVIQCNDVVLTWTTATEANNCGFDIERRSIGHASDRWRKIGFVEGAGQTYMA